VKEHESPSFDRCLYLRGYFGLVKVIEFRCQNGLSILSSKWFSHRKPYTEILLYCFLVFLESEDAETNCHRSLCTGNHICYMFGDWYRHNLLDKERHCQHWTLERMYNRVG